MATVISNLPALVTWQVYQNDTLKKTIALLDDDSNPVDLSTAINVRLQVRKSAGSTVLFAMELSDGITVGGADNNVIYLNKDLVMKAGKYKYDLEITHATSDVQTIFRGDFIVTADITRTA